MEREIVNYPALNRAIETRLTGRDRAAVGRNQRPWFRLHPLGLVPDAGGREAARQGN